MNIVIATDSFKGSLSSKEAGESMAKAACEIFPDAQIQVLGVSDGGEGMCDAFAQATDGETIEVSVHNPFWKPISAHYVLGFQKTAYIEMAAASGITLIKRDELDPMNATTFGTGELILDAIEQGAKKLVIGLGGSATNDAGIGMLSALGWRFIDKDGLELPPCGKNLIRIKQIDNKQSLSFENIEVIAACDVKNPLYGKNGAAYIFAAQKGATHKQIEELDLGLQHFGNLIKEQYGTDYAQLEGAGAAGGVGVALACFAKANMKSGIQLLIETDKWQQALSKADLIITGEGKLDSQSSMGKVVWGILTEAQKLNTPVYAVAGKVEDKQKAIEWGFSDVCQSSPNELSLEEAMKPSIAKQNIYLATKSLLQHINSKSSLS